MGIRPARSGVPTPPFAGFSAIRGGYGKVAGRSRRLDACSGGFGERRGAAAGGGAGRHRRCHRGGCRQAGSPEQAVRAGPPGVAVRPRHVRGGRPTGQRHRRWPAGRRRHHRPGPGGGSPRGGGGQRPHGEGRLVGSAHRREDRARHRGGAGQRVADLLAGGFRRGAHHRPSGFVPGPARGGAHLLQPGAALGQGAPDLLPVRAVGGRRRLHTGGSATWCSWWRPTPPCTWGRRAWPRW